MKIGRYNGVEGEAGQGLDDGGLNVVLPDAREIKTPQEHSAVLCSTGNHVIRAAHKRRPGHVGDALGVAFMFELDEGLEGVVLLVVHPDHKELVGPGSLSGGLGGDLKSELVIGADDEHGGLVHTRVPGDAGDSAGVDVDL